MKYTGENIASGCGALLDVGLEKTTMIIWAEGALVLARAIPIAGLALTEEPQSPGQNSPFHSLADEVQRSLLAYESGEGARAVENIFLTGGGSGASEHRADLGGADPETISPFGYGRKFFPPPA